MELSSRMDRASYITWLPPFPVDKPVPMKQEDAIMGYSRAVIRFLLVTFAEVALILREVSSSMGRANRIGRNDAHLFALPIEPGPVPMEYSSPILMRVTLPPLVPPVPNALDLIGIPQPVWSKTMDPPEPTTLVIPRDLPVA